MSTEVATTPLAQNTVHHGICPVCSSAEIFEALTAKDYTVSGEQFGIWECRNCSLRFTQDIPVEEEVGVYYQSEDYVSHSNTSKGLINNIYQRVRKRTLKSKRKLVESAAKQNPGRILDIGCGTGEFLSTMIESGWEGMGLEPDEGAAAQSKSLGLKVYSNEELFRLGAEGFDVVTMWHVLEHVHRLHEYMGAIHRVLKPGGLLLIAVPNYTSADAANYGPEWAAYDVPRHLYHFSPKSMGALLPQHRFDLEEMKHMPFDPFYVSLLSEKCRHGSPRLVSAAFRGFGSWLKSSANASLGSSVMYFCRKQ
ncbi:MAG: class I SAM-dependent methyltransferase [Bacteroidia bacterium]